MTSYYPPPFDKRSLSVKTFNNGRYNKEVFMTNKSISQKLQQARKNAGLSQRDMYSRLGVSQSTFSSWETGKSEPSISNFLKLCESYGIVNIADYFAGSGTSRQPEPDSHILNKLLSLDETGRAAVCNCLDFEYRAMQRRLDISRRSILIYTQSSAAAAECTRADLAAPCAAEAGMCVTDDSMEPLIHSGDIVFIKHRDSLTSGEIGAFIYEDKLYCRKIEYCGGETRLYPLNSAFPVIRISDGGGLRLLGGILL